ncbi:hypothetical protein ACEQ8H_007645 [Pleosporales sp. CAS-2024a]
MHLLKYQENGDLSIAKFEDKKPPYAILSHRWRAEADEVTFEDVANNTGKDKPGYTKIRFCGKQAQRDGLQYFWIDTCCIDKKDKPELHFAIQSMFRWYQNAIKCYVYLFDVSIKNRKAGSTSTEFVWESALKSSQWFTRGWTLQELLAPGIVEFYSLEWEKLGDKISLKTLIHKTTNIPYKALDGAPLSQFSVNERLRWIEHRQTTRPEDKVYSLLGVVDVDLAPCYGEGVDGAFKRLHNEIDKTKKCIRDLCGTDPRDDKKRIEDTKGGLLQDLYRWVFDNDSFKQWHEDSQSQLLWIKGDPGKGKTMLLCGIIDQLQVSSSIAKTDTVSYFFCQATDRRINSATAVLRGLLYMLVSQQPSLVSYIRERYDIAGKNIFEDVNAWFVLVEIFTDVLRKPNLTTTYLIIDALDECTVDLPKLLGFIAKQSSASVRTKWIVSSRNWPEIEGRLEQAGHKVNLSLERNSASVSTSVQAYIKQRVSELAQQNKYDEATKRTVLERLASNAHDTFLWVALVCQHLQATARRNVLTKLELIPPGLDGLYERMMQQISKTDDAELCKQMLAVVALVYRPIALQELVALVEPLEKITDDSELQEIIGLCGSFLVLREQTVYFVHQSAKDFLLSKATRDIFPAEKEAFHWVIFARSLQLMSALQRDMYGIKVLGTPIDDVEIPEPDPLAALRYSCVHWIDHLCDSNPTSCATYAECLRDRGSVDTFLREKFLYWLESLSLCKSMSKGIISIRKLQMLVQVCPRRATLPYLFNADSGWEQGEGVSFTQLVYDACRFVMYHKQAIESNPLQAYGSALLFSPTNSLIRTLFNHETPEYISIRPAIGSTWSACLQTLEGHNDAVVSVAFSHDSLRLASGSWDKTVIIWDSNSGECLQTLKGHNHFISSIAFSYNSSRLVSGSWDDTVKIWDSNSGECLRTLNGHSDAVSSVAFSHDSIQLVASGSWDKTIKIWDSKSGECLRTLNGHSEVVSSVAFSLDSTRLVSVSFLEKDGKIRLWDLSQGKCLQILKSPNGSASSGVFSHDSALLASVSSVTSGTTVELWDGSSFKWLQTLEGNGDPVFSVAFSHDSAQLASGSRNGTIKIWDLSTGECLRTHEGHSDIVYSLAFSHDSVQLVSGSVDRTVKIWNASSTGYSKTPKGHSSRVIIRIS